MLKINIKNTINVAPILFVLAIVTGVLVHDLRIDKATSVAMALPAMLATYGAAHFISGGGEHIHVERVAFSNQSSIFHSNLPKIPPRDEFRGYVQAKKPFLTGGNGSGSIWPSI